MEKLSDHRLGVSLFLLNMPYRPWGSYHILRRLLGWVPGPPEPHEPQKRTKYDEPLVP